MQAWQEMAQKVGQGDAKEIRGLILYLVCLADGLYWEKDEEGAKTLHRLLVGLEKKGFDVLSWLQMRADSAKDDMERDESHFALALIYGYGLLGTIDLNQAKNYLVEVTNPVFKGPIHYFEAVFLESSREQVYFEVVEKYKESLKYWDSSQVLYRLSLYLFHNLNSDEDLLECLDYAHLASVNGHAKACELLGRIYLHAEELVSAWAWYWIAMQKGNETIREDWLKLEDRVTSEERVRAKLLVEEFLST